MAEVKQKYSAFHHKPVREHKGGKVKKQRSSPRPRHPVTSKMRRPVVRYVDPKTQQLSDVATFGTDVFISAGVSPKPTDAMVVVEQDENKDLVVKTGEEGALPAGSYTIRDDFAGMVSRIMLTQVFPAVYTKSQLSTVRVASVVLPVIRFASGAEYLLLTQRTHMKKGTYNDFWVFPGGHVEAGESLRAGGIREMKEETGLKIHAKDLHPVCVWQEFMASSKKQLQFIITNFYCEIEVEEGLDESHFLLTLGLQLKEVKRAVLMPRSSWRMLAHTETYGHNKEYSHRAYEDINWPEEDTELTHVLGIVNHKSHAKLAQVGVGEILSHTRKKPGIGMPHSFAVHHLLPLLSREAQS